MEFEDVSFPRVSSAVDVLQLSGLFVPNLLPGEDVEWQKSVLESNAAAGTWGQSRVD